MDAVTSKPVVNTTGTGHGNGGGGAVLTVPPLLISGQTIAKKKKWTNRERAHAAAKWWLRRSNGAPTKKMAADVFGVSIPLMNEALVGLKYRAAKTSKTINKNKPNGDGALSSGELDAFVRSNLLAVWDSIERVTA